MKLRLLLALGVGIGTGVTSVTVAEETARSSGVRINLDEPAPDTRKSEPAKPTVKNAPAAQDSKQGPKQVAPAKDTKKKDAQAKIDGMELSRGDRGYLGVKVDGGFKIAFYDKNKKPIAGDVAQIVLRWPVQYQRNDERALLVPVDDGKVFASERVVRPPYSFKLFITLLKSSAPGENADAESYVVDFSQ